MSACGYYGRGCMKNTLLSMLDPSSIVYESYAFDTYAVVDGVKYPMLYSDLEEGILEYDMLFKEEKLREKLETVAPFLVKLDFESKVGKEESTALITQCSKNNGAIFFATPLSFAETLQKMRTLFYLYDEQDEMEGVLRFYEPRIFSELMHESNKALHQTFFSQVYAYWCEDITQENTFLKYMYTPEGIGYRSIIIDEESKERDHDI